jgi:uncharacterized protein (DUF697 family)
MSPPRAVSVLAARRPVAHNEVSMNSALARPVVIHWRFALLASYVLVNLIIIPQTVLLGTNVGQDWALWIAVAESSNPYQTDTIVPFVWSPLMAPVMSAVVAVGYWPWAAAHIVAVLFLRAPLLIGLVLVSYGFWFDVAQGNTLTFSLVAGMLALRGSRCGGIAFFALFVLMPRPLMAPLAVWLLWRDRSLVVPVAAMVVGHAAAAVASGWGMAWIQAMASYSGPPVTYGFAFLLGAWWLPVALPLAAWLTWRRHFGWAGLAVSPYVLPQYLVWPLVELARHNKRMLRSESVEAPIVPPRATTPASSAT